MKLPPISRKTCVLLFFTAFIIRGLLFYSYVQHEQRYRQPDSSDYHNCALGIVLGTGMHRADTKEPIFWRTPGYPAYLSSFYYLHGLRSAKFQDNTPAQKAALWVQIFINSFIPLILLMLAYVLTSSLWIAQITAWISVFHPGFVLASTFLLTEGLGLIFFFLFSPFFYTCFRLPGEMPNHKKWLQNTILAAACLGIFTWIRPMGEFIAILSSLIMLFAAADSWRINIKRVALFLSIFFAITFGWYARNHALTGSWFFCPMLGPYLNTFTAPKVLRDVYDSPLKNCIHVMYKQANENLARMKELPENQGRVVPQERACIDVALPILRAHPFLVMKHWAKEVIKSTFDLYSYQFTALANNTFMYDPLEEFLCEKLADCLYAKPMPFWMRIVAWLELIYAILLWIGLFAGAWLFMIVPICKRFVVQNSIKQLCLLWLKVAPVIGSIIFMTGGFGYARLRLPVEPLMIILSLTFWQWYYDRKNQKENS